MFRAMSEKKKKKRYNSRSMIQANLGYQISLVLGESTLDSAQFWVVKIFWKHEEKEFFFLIERETSSIQGDMIITIALQ